MLLKNRLYHLNIKSYPDVIEEPVIPLIKDYDYYASLPPEKYPEELKLWYKGWMGKDLDLENPVTFNEKLQWMKLYDSTPIKTRLADKYLVREYIKEKIGEEYLIPLIGVYDSFDEIDIEALPDKFVMKANHGSGWNIIVKNKADFDISDAREKFNNWLKMNYAFVTGFELHYLNMKPKIVIEEYLENDGGTLDDYKVFCFGGEVERVLTVQGRGKHERFAYYDKSWNKLPQDFYGTFNEENVPKPERLELLLELSQKLAEGFPHVRVDFYVLNDGSLKFGELTFTHSSGLTTQYDEANKYYGDKIVLPAKSPMPVLHKNING